MKNTGLPVRPIPNGFPLLEEYMESFGFHFKGKEEAASAADRASEGHLAYVPEKSYAVAENGNLYIEGDNLPVLKALLSDNALEGAVSVIYIDPPYNTGGDFSFHDRYESQELSSSDRHSAWCAMIYPLLILSKRLLSKDGAFFVSIGEEEVHHLRMMADEVFGEENFRSAIHVRRADKNLSRQFALSGLQSLMVGTEYILMYSKDPKARFQPVYRPGPEGRKKSGYWKGFWNNAERPTMRYSLFGVTPNEGQWKWQESVAREAAKNYEEYLEGFSSAMSLEEYWEFTGRQKRFLRLNPNGKGKNQGVEHWVSPSDGILRSTDWTDLLISKAAQVPFDSPKNPEVIETLLRHSNIGPDGICLDFFSGSATTGVAVMNLNAQDKGKRKFILVQSAEPVRARSKASASGFEDIASLGAHRLKLVMEKMAEKMPALKGELGFGYYRLEEAGEV